jgi:dTDP-4-dehydrorhamnose reductase
MSSVLITGTTGLVGSNVYEYLKKNTNWDVTGVSLSPGDCVDFTANLTDRDAVERLRDYDKFNTIIHTAAISKTDICENQKAECYAVNVVATRNLAEVFRSSTMVFFSTYAAYNTPAGNCDEHCPIFPTNHYISTKIEAEGIVNGLTEAIILRPSVIFGYTRFFRQTKNYFMQLLDNVQNRKVMQSPVDQYFNPIHVDCVTRLVYLALNKGIHGIYNIGCNENISKFEFNRMIMKKFRFDESLLEGIESRHLQVLRPNNGTISSKKIQADLGIEIPSLQDMIDVLYTSTKQ